MGVEDVFSEYLFNDEEILWTGKPDEKVLFTKSDILLIPVSTLLFIASILIELNAIFTVLGKVPPEHDSNPGWGLVIFVLIYVGMCFYFSIGRFIYKRYNKKNTYYAVTNKRILIKNNSSMDNFNSKYIDKIDTIKKSRKKYKTGTIKFGDMSLFTAFYENTGLEFIGSLYANDVPTFYDIKEVDEVFKLVTQLRNSEK